MSKTVFGRIANELMAPNKERSRALPDSKGGEAPKQLQTYRTEVFAYFTSPGPTQLLYSAENWVRIKLALQTAGPVAVGTRAALEPITSGKGILLDTNVEYEVYLSKGARFYIASGAVNRVNVTIEPVPWLEQISMDLGRVSSTVSQAAGAIVAGISNALLTRLSGQSKMR
jgi:hypothetical protein